MLLSYIALVMGRMMMIMAMAVMMITVIRVRKINGFKNNFESFKSGFVFDYEYFHF